MRGDARHCGNAGRGDVCGQPGGERQGVIGRICPGQAEPCGRDGFGLAHIFVGEAAQVARERDDIATNHAAQGGRADIERSGSRGVISLVAGGHTADMQGQRRDAADIATGRGGQAVISEVRRATG